MRKIILAFVLSMIVGVIGVVLFNHFVQTVQATDHHNVWQTTYGDWSTCTPNKETDSCEGGGGTKTRTVTKTCVSTNGEGRDQCKIEVSCPEGYKLDDNQCKKTEWQYQDRTFNLVCPNGYSLNPGQSNCRKVDHYTCPQGWTLDGNKCKKHNQQDQNATPVYDYKDKEKDYNNCPNGWQVYNTTQCRKQVTETTDKIYTPEVQKSEETAVCTVPANPDECQVQCPANSTANSDKVCTCNSGYHSVNQNEVATDLVSLNLVCEPDPTPPQECKDVGFGCNGSPSFPHDQGVPTCTEGNTINLPANVHVIRSGSDATVNFFITEGDSANVYWSVVGQPHWGNSSASEFPDGVKPNSDKFVSYTVHNLDLQMGYDFGVQQKQGCGGGQTVTAVVVDGPISTTFQYNYWEWNN